MHLLRVALLCLLSAHALADLSNYGKCQTPNRENGLCLHVEDCQYLYDMLISLTLSDADRQYLQQSQCGYDNTQTAISKRVLVCCAAKYFNGPTTTSAKSSDAGNVLPQAGVCGSVLSNRIYGGNVTGIDEFPWMALIQYKKPNNRYDFHCGATLINSRYVLTAAHCVRNAEMPSTWEVHQVRLGEWDLETNPDCEEDITGKKDCATPHVDVPVERVIVHADYVPGSRDQFNDIALIRLTRPVIYNDFIMPICLPASAEMRAKSFQGNAMDVAGWGMTEKSQPSTRKLKIVVNVWDVAECGKTYSTFEIGINETIQLCAGGKEGIDTCRGDSGGPLMLKELLGNRDIYYLTGVVSYGPKPCGLRGWPGVYTRVSHFINWITSNLEP